MEPVDILGRVDRQQNRVGIDLRRQGQLHQDAVDAVVGISEGAGAIDPGASDLSAMPDNSATGTTYELFDFSNNFDLDDAILSFE